MAEVEGTVEEFEATSDVEYTDDGGAIVKIDDEEVTRPNRA